MNSPAELRKLIAAATPGPWKGGGAAGYGWIGGPRGENVLREQSRSGTADAELVAALRNQAPAILALWEAALAYYDDLEKSDVELDDALRAALEGMGKE